MKHYTLLLLLVHSSWFNPKWIILYWRLFFVSVVIESKHNRIIILIWSETKTKEFSNLKMIWLVCARKNKKITFSFRKGFWSFISFCLCVSISCIKQNPSGLILVLANLYIWGFSLFCFRCFVVFGSRMITKIVLFFSKRKLFIQAELFISSRFFWAILVLFSFSLISIIFVFAIVL